MVAAMISTASSDSAVPSGQKPLSRLDLLFALCVSLLCLSVIVEKLTDSVLLGQVTAALFVLFVVLGQGRVRLRERFLLTIALGVSVAALLFHPASHQPFDTASIDLVVGGLARAGYLVAFMILLSLLQVGAGISPSILTLGRYLTEQPPGRRYLTLHVGGHFFGVLLNFGAISLLAPMIQRGVKSQSVGRPPLTAAYRERRQLSALTRGFSWFNIWAPTSIAQVVVLATVVESSALIVGLSGGAIALILVGVGWYLDRQTGKQVHKELVQGGLTPAELTYQPFPWSAFGRFLGVAFLLVAGGGLAAFVFHLPLVTAVMVVALPITIGWILLLCHARADGRSLRREKIRGLFLQSAPAGSPEAMTLATAGFIGLVGAGLVDGAWLADGLNLQNVPPVLIYILVAALLPLASSIGLPPMLMVTFLGSLLTGLEGTPLNPTWLALAFLCGWSMNLTGSHFGATALVLGRVAGVAGTTYAWRWNGVFTLVSFLVTALALWVYGTNWP
ncbi:hypothetical protein ACTL6U_05660 [Rhodovibrionaceae bacterium A322]